MKYEHRVVAFIDILGFRSHIDETTDKAGNDNEKKIQHMVSAYEAIKKVWEEDDFIAGTKVSSSKRVSIFSDSIVVSFKAEEPNEVFYTLLNLKHLIMTLIYKRLLCRGAVSIGKFLHTDDYLFGPALVEAYTLESKAAMYPRIILDRDVIEASLEGTSVDHKETDEIDYVESLLEQDSDGMYYIDYFYKARSELIDSEYDFPEYIEILGELIRKGLMGSSHHGKADLRVKYSWMRERYNRMIDTVQSREALKGWSGPGQDEITDFYLGLKKISPRKDNKRLHSDRFSTAARFQTGA
jgi:hypothetical protein